MREGCGETSSRYWQITEEFEHEPTVMNQCGHNPVWIESQVIRLKVLELQKFNTMLRPRQPFLGQHDADLERLHRIPFVPKLDHRTAPMCRRAGAS